MRFEPLTVPASIAGKMTKHVQLLAALVATELVRALMAKVDLAGRIVSVAFFVLVGAAVFRAILSRSTRCRSAVASVSWPERVRRAASTMSLCLSFIYGAF